VYPTPAPILRPNVVTVIPVGVGREPGGGKTQPEGAGVVIKGVSVQADSGQRFWQHGKEQSQVSARILFTAGDPMVTDPVTNTVRSLRVADKIVWGNKVFTVLHPSADQAGRSGIFSFDVEQKPV
jgi:hypothetical protein